MVKSGKKRRLPAAAASGELFNLTGVDLGDATGVSASSLENCLEELEGSATPGAPHAVEVTSSQPPNSKKRSLEETFEDGFEHHKLWDPDLETAQSVALLAATKTRVRNWNEAFHGWISQGTYTPGLLPSFDVELARHFQVKELSSFLLKSCSNLKMPSFERWLIDSKLEEKHRQASSADKKSAHKFALFDPVLCGTVTVDFESSKRLVAEVVDASSGSIKQDAAEKIVQELCRRTTQTAIPQIHSDSRRCLNQIPLKKDRIEIEHHGLNSVSLLYHRKRWKKPFCVKLNLHHYEKLQQMFLTVHEIDACKIRWNEVGGKQTKATQAFHLLLMVLVLRYSSLSGGQLLNDLRGGGMQGAVHGAVFEVLRKTFLDSCLLECFASPLNAYLPCFQSAFHDDIDWHFGSLGNFFDDDSLPVTEGCLEANPPFSPGLMDAMVDRFETLLGQSDCQNKALTIIVIVPSANVTDSSITLPSAKRFALSSFQKLISSSNCRLHIVLSSREHGYVEGAQHLRPTRYKDSNYDSSVIVLQSTYALKLDLETKDFEDKIRAAFTSLHKKEIEQKREAQRKIE